MFTDKFALALTLTASLAYAQQMQADSTVPTFRAQSNIVLVPFHVTRGNGYVTALQRSDLVLLQDGHPRDFSIFDGPGTKDRLPVELILLFDTTLAPWKWSTIAQYARGGPYDLKEDFTKGWEDAVSRAVLAGDGSDVRIAIYRFDLMQLERLSRPTRDPKELVSAVQALRTPMPLYTDRMTASQREELRIEDESTFRRMHNLIDTPVSGWGWPGFEHARDSEGVYIPLELPPARKNRDAASPPGTGQR